MALMEEDKRDLLGQIADVLAERSVEAATEEGLVIDLSAHKNDMFIPGMVSEQLSKLMRDANHVGKKVIISGVSTNDYLYRAFERNGIADRFIFKPKQ